MHPRLSIFVVKDYLGSGDFDTDDEDYEYIDYEGNDYYSVDNPVRVEPVIDNDIESQGLSDLVIRITLKMIIPWNDALGRNLYIIVWKFTHQTI